MLVVLAAAALAGSLAKVKSISFDELVRLSDAIVVAQVVDSVRAPLAEPPLSEPWVLRGAASIGALKVERWFKGEPTDRELLFLNQSAWTCDITGARVGDRAVFFLQLDLETKALRERVEDWNERFGERPLYRVTHAGRGQMGLRAVEGRELATVWKGDVVLGADAPVEAGPEPEYDFIVSLELTWLRAAVKRCVEEQRSVWLRASARPGADASPWSFALRRDRTARLDVRTLQGDRSIQWTLDPWRTQELEARLEKLQRAWALGDCNGSEGTRELELLTAQGTKRFGDAGVAASCLARFDLAWAHLCALFDVSHVAPRGGSAK